MAVLAGCDRSPPEAGRPPAGPTLEVEFAGCAAVAGGPVCRLAPGTAPVVWARSAPDARVEARLAGEPPLAPAAEVDGGFRFDLETPAALPASLTIVAARGAAESRFELELVLNLTPGWLDEARSLALAGETDRARELLASRLPDLAAGPRAKALSLMARIDYGSGQPERAEVLLRRAVAAHREAGDELGAVNDASMLVYLLQRRRAVDEARAQIEALDPPALGPSEALYYAAFHGGLLARETGDLRAAVRSLESAAAHARRVGLTRERLLAEQPLATALERIGRHEESATLFAEIAARLERRPELLGDCERAEVYNNHGWHLLLAREAERSGPDPLPSLVRAAELLETACESWEEAYNVRVNLAFAETLAGSLEAARGWLEAADLAAARRAPETRMRLWRLHVEGLLANASGDPVRALAAWERLADDAGAAHLPELTWRAEIGRAAALDRLGRPEDALGAYAMAEGVLERESLEVALQGGRQTFVARRERGTRLYIERLLAAGRAERALEVARRARARVVHGIGRRGGLAGLLPEERALVARASQFRASRSRVSGEPDSARPVAKDSEAWGLPGDVVERLEVSRAAGREALRRWVDDLFADSRGPALAEPLPRPAPGTVLLAFHPLPEGWAVFALDEAGVDVHRTGPLAPLLAAIDRSREPVPGGDLEEAAADEATERLAAELLAPVASKIRAARRVRLLTYGELAPIELHALPFDGAPLVAGREVEYGLDLGELPDTAASRRALVVGDPTGDLPGALAEAWAVESALGAAGWSVTAWTGDAARAARLATALGAADLFHYAGHAEPGPHAAWRSRLALAGGGLAVEDVLTLERSPAAVVLSGCETAGAGARRGGESLGLAHAFLVAGSRWVIATTRPIPDRYSAEVVASFYDAWLGGEAPAAALGRAQLDLARAEPDAPWRSFRLLSR